MSAFSSTTTFIKSTSPIEFGYYPYRRNEIFKMNSLFSRPTKWKPKISLYEGISEILKVEYEKN